jgi:hypothetical protein
MSKVISLKGYRNKTRQAYWAKNGARLDRFLARFIQNHIEDDFRQIALDYQAARHAMQDASWDYVHFREILAEAMDEVFGRALYGMLQAQLWFDARVVTRDEVMDRCLSMYIMNECQQASTSR